ncbi:intercellular adhesion molecule 5 isoform X2 [Esox lucius]|uniref:intercellular adhesion molecule 5 isoform X2 n=1 Tax=Esox lucius TaxID=8010 RepID=UPI0014773DB3|nr:intercellular adhesion molecule 5 isoform X2 [Esox lucius]
MLAFLVLMLLDRAADGACPPDTNLQTVELPEVVVRHADLLQINCTALFHKQLGRHCVFTEEHTSLLVARNLTRVDWDTQAHCSLKLNESLQYKNLTITVYKTPDSMSISLLNHSGPMVEGTEYHLQCDILNVAPVQNLIVKWYKGNESLLNVTYSNSTKTPVDVFPTLIVTPSSDDDGAQYRCEAELDLGPEGPQPPPTVSSKYQIYVVQPQNQPTPFPTTPGSKDIVQPTAKPKGHNDLLELNPPIVVVEYGDPVSVNCSTSSTDHEGMGWEATQGGTDFQLNATIVTWIVDNLEDWTIKPMCYITTSTNQVTKMLPVILYKTPDNMSISLLDHSGPMVEGTEYHLQCDILNVAPVQNLIVKCSDDDGAQYRCEAELDLGPEGPQPPPTVSSEPLIITVHYKPDIKCPLQYIGVEKNFTLDKYCVVMGNPPPDTEWNWEGKHVNASKPLNRKESGRYTISAFNHQGSTNATVEIIVEYAPEWTCPSKIEIKENESLLECKANGQPEPEVRWYKDQTSLDPPRTWTRQNRGEYTLVSSNKHGEASHTVHIDVLYAPEIHLTTPGIVRAGSDVSLGCSAQGNPLPEVKWNYTVADNVNLTNDGHQRTVRITRATSTNAGIYICTATNRVGRDTRETTVTISTIDYSTILMVASLIVFLVILILLVYYCRRRKRRGDYHFHPINSNIQMAPLPPDSK